MSPRKKQGPHKANDLPDWPEVDDFVSSQLPAGAEDPYLADDEDTSAEWWDNPSPARPRNPPSAS